MKLPKKSFLFIENSSKKVKYILSGNYYSEEEDVFQDFLVEQMKCKMCSLVYDYYLLLQVNWVSHVGRCRPYYFLKIQTFIVT